MSTSKSRLQVKSILSTSTEAQRSKYSLTIVDTVLVCWASSGSGWWDVRDRDARVRNLLEPFLNLCRVRRGDNIERGIVWDDDTAH